MLAAGGKRGLIQSHEAPSAAVVFCWSEEILQKSRWKGRVYAVFFPCCEYSLRATQATDSSLEESFQRAALKEDIRSVSHWQVPEMLPSPSGGSAKRTALGNDQLKEIA